MKIALMTNNYKPVMGGVPISVERLSKSLTELGNEVTVFAPTYDNQTEEKNVFRYRTLFKHFLGGIVFPNSLDPAIEKEIRDGKYDIIHVNHPVLIGNRALRLSRKYNIPVVFTYHTRYEQYLYYLPMVKHLEDLSEQKNTVGRISGKTLKLITDKLMPAYICAFAKKCDCIFAPTPGMKTYLETACNVEPDKVRVVPTGLENDEYITDSARVKEIRKKHIKNGEYLFVSVSRISGEKNIEFLIDAMEKLKAKTDIPFKLLFVGDGPEKAHFIEECRERGLDEIEFVGKVPNEDVKNYCQAADAFLFSSKSETQGIVILESLAVGTPVVALSASGVEDVVLNGINGILTGEDSDVYSDRLLTYMRGEIDNDRLSANAVFTALEFKEERIAEKVSVSYNEAVALKNSNRRKYYGRKIPYLAG